MVGLLDSLECRGTRASRIQRRVLAGGRRGVQPRVTFRDVEVRTTLLPSITSLRVGQGVIFSAKLRKKAPQRVLVVRVGVLRAATLLVHEDFPGSSSLLTTPLHLLDHISEGAMVRQLQVFVDILVSKHLEPRFRRGPWPRGESSVEAVVGGLLALLAFVVALHTLVFAGVAVAKGLRVVVALAVSASVSFALVGAAFNGAAFVLRDLDGDGGR